MGFCRVAATAIVSSAGPHCDEESCLVGARGSGTIFLAGCNLACLFCQNYDISHENPGQPRRPDQIAAVVLAGFLIFSGLGSFLTRRSTIPVPKLVAFCVAAISLLALSYLLGMNGLFATAAQLVPWAWAVNGFLAAVALYGLAAALATRLRATATDR